MEATFLPHSSSVSESRALNNTVAILDAGAQYGKVIDRRVRSLSVKSEMLPIETSAHTLSSYGAIIISGGPQSVYAKNAPKVDPEIYNLSVPILGICYGMQLVTHDLGGKVVKKSLREDGISDVIVDQSSALFSNIAKKQHVLMSHGDSIEKLASGFSQIARSGEIVAGIEDKKRRIWGLQFHPEVDLTKNGLEMLKNFLFNVAKLDATFSVGDRCDEAIAYIRSKVGKKNALLFISGGVDSLVCAALLRQAIAAKQIHAVHIDSGFMRLGESKDVMRVLSEIGIDVHLVNAQKDFLHATTMLGGKRSEQLSETCDPEVKRAIIGDQFVTMKNKIMKNLGLKASNTVLVQGTLRPDLIESANSSASGKADVIKTHHNDTESIRKLRKKGLVIEPLSEYHKDEVRELGTMLGLPRNLVWRQPFPGPGLAIRILCARNAYKRKNHSAVLAKVKQFETKTLRVVLLPIRSVGVQGDGRTYSYVVGLLGKISWKKLVEIARRLPREVHEVNRVVYIFGDSSEKSVDCITPTFLQTEEIEQLQEADAAVRGVLDNHDMQERLSQVPVILTPLCFGKIGERSIVLRPFLTNDFMTGVPAVPGVDISAAIIKEIVKEVSNVSGISKVMYDLTSKPPGTTEWE